MHTTQPVTNAALRGMQVLTDPKLNKGTAVTEEERERLGLAGLLPDSVEGLDEQLERVLGHLQEKPTDLERYIYLVGLADRNETLFYKLLMSDPMRFLPIVYDPTVGEACLNRLRGGAAGLPAAHPAGRRHDEPNALGRPPLPGRATSRKILPRGA
jgi:hypothetical protein